MTDPTGELVRISTRSGSDQLDETVLTEEPPRAACFEHPVGLENEGIAAAQARVPLIQPNVRERPKEDAADSQDFDGAVDAAHQCRWVTTGRLLEAPLGGLNHLRHAQPLIRQFCTDHGIAYHETTLIQPWSQGAGTPARDRDRSEPPANSGFGVTIRVPL